MHRHDRRQIQKLLLSSGKLTGVFPKPGLNPEVAGHLGNPAIDFSHRTSEVLQTKGQLMPYLVRHDLALRILPDVSDLGSVPAVVQQHQIFAVVPDRPVSDPIRHQTFFQMAH